MNRWWSNTHSWYIGWTMFFFFYTMRPCLILLSWFMPNLQNAQAYQILWMVSFVDFHAFVMFMPVEFGINPPQSSLCKKQAQCLLALFGNQAGIGCAFANAKQRQPDTGAKCEIKEGKWGLMLLNDHLSPLHIPILYLAGAFKHHHPRIPHHH